MKKSVFEIRRFVVLLVGLLMMFNMTACGENDKNMREELPGEYFVWHWYYVEGESGFYDNAIFYTFTDDGSLTIKENVDNAEATEATYVWENDNTIIVSYPDGKSETFEIAPHKYDGREELTYTNVDTGLILSMQYMSDWTEE